MKRTAVIICPGRGTYNKSELGYIHRHHADKTATMDLFERERRAADQVSLAELDAADRFSSELHTRGDNASALIFAASYLDALEVIDAFDVVAVTGNSMGWYTSLAVAGATRAEEGFRIANTMGRLMHESMIGGQLVYPVVGETWRPDPEKRTVLHDIVLDIDTRPDCALAVSIDLGGMLVLAGNARGLEAFEAGVPRVRDRFPLRLRNHAAFHTSLQAPVSDLGRAALGKDLFSNCDIPMIDGRGVIWWPRSYSVDDLWDYTLGYQVTETYDFSSAVRVAARNFAPDVFVVLGPGDTMGGAVAQSLIAIDWQGLSDKAAFQERQAENPIVISLGRESDRTAALHADALETV